RGPIRVFFDLGSGVLREALVTSSNANQIQVLTPAVDLGVGQTQAATIIVFTEQGTAAEGRLTAAFTFRKTVLTPRITTVSPDSGPITGGTRITIFGDGFEAPVQVSFAPGGSGGSLGWSQMQVLNVTFNQIIAITPTARDVNPNGSGPLTGTVDLRVVNINSATEAIAGVVFRYTPKVQITGISPHNGTALGGTRVQIDGIGFDDPISVSIAGVEAQVVSVTGSRVIVVTNALAVPCAGVSGAVTVQNVENGDGDVYGDDPIEQGYNYLAVSPVITGVTSGGPITPGSTVAITVLNPGVGAIRIVAGGSTLIPTPSISTTSVGTATFTIVLPTTGFTFPSLTCTPPGGAAGSGTQLGPVSVDLVFNNVTTTCSDRLPMGLTVQPPGPNLCETPPRATVAPTGIAPDCANAPPVVAAGAITSTATITISNAANARDLLITNANVTAATNATITIAPGNATIPAGMSQIFTVTVDPTAVGPVTGTANFTTNDPQRGSIAVCITGSGT
ncbi:MAG TPA: IPT/TIG domain-containing protein, partial [Thermoanaerobaculia bacterium]|nr:IPT/TIG domain-containing protein [Thermoanaerobaculia bacterium]